MFMKMLMHVTNINERYIQLCSLKSLLIATGAYRYLQQYIYSYLVQLFPNNVNQLKLCATY